MKIPKLSERAQWVIFILGATVLIIIVKVILRATGHDGVWWPM